MKIRDWYVRSANMRKIELDGRRIKISPFLKANERFDRKRLGFIKCMIRKIKGIALHWIQMSYEKKSITIDGQFIAMIDASGKLRYNKYEDIDEEVQYQMKKAVKKLVTTTVSSREKGLERRNGKLTRSDGGTTKKQQKEK